MQKMKVLRWIGVFLALAHLIVSWSFIIYIRTRPYYDAQWVLVWYYFLPIDFPFSLLVFLALNENIRVFLEPLSEFLSLPEIIHGIIGPIWYYFLPRVVWKIAVKTKHIFSVLWSKFFKIQ